MADPISAIALGTAATSATATTAATAATAGLFGSAGTFSLLSTASTLGTFMGIGSALSGGSADRAMAESQARWEEFRARQDRLRGQQEATRIKEDLARSVSTAVAVGGAQGIDISSGSPANAIQKANQDANYAWNVAQYNSEMDARASEVNAYSVRQRGKNAYRSSRATATGMFTDFLGKQSDRGVRF